LEACNYREAYNHFNQFLLFPREERKRLCEEAFLNPTDPENLRSLNEVKARLDARPTEKAEQEAALKDLYTLWNAALEELERQLPDQAPKDPIALPSDWLAVVVGGKYLPTKGLRGLGDELVVELLEKTTADVMCLSRGDTGVPALPAQDSRFAHFKDMHKMMEQVAAVKGDRKVVFFQTIGMTWDNGQCMFNIETIESFLDELKQFNLLADGNAKVVHTSTFHASPASAKHQDSLDAFANYGLADYGASKVMQGMLLAQGLYADVPEVSSTDAYSELTTLIEDLRKHMDICHAHWAANPADAASRSLPEVMTEMIRGLVDSMQNAADLFFEDTAGEQSIIYRLSLASERTRYDVVKIPYMLSNTAVYKRHFVFNPPPGKGVFEFYCMVSLARFKIAMTPERGAMWHLGVASELLSENSTSENSTL